MRHSALASNPPDASTTPRARTSLVRPPSRTRTPWTPSSSWSNDMARASYRTSTPARAAAACSESTRPGPPPAASTVTPPQNLNLPPTLKAWRP